MSANRKFPFVIRRTVPSTDPKGSMNTVDPDTALAKLKKNVTVPVLPIEPFPELYLTLLSPVIPETPASPETDSVDSKPSSGPTPSELRSESTPPPLPRVSPPEVEQSKSTLDLSGDTSRPSKDTPVNSHKQVSFAPTHTVLPDIAKPPLKAKEHVAVFPEPSEDNSLQDISDKGSPARRRSRRLQEKSSTATVPVFRKSAKHVSPESDLDRPTKYPPSAAGDGEYVIEN